MEKIAVGPGYPKGVVDLDATPTDNIMSIAKAKGVKPNEITACIMDRPRHARFIEEVWATGAAIRLIGDGDVAGVMHTTDPDETGIDIYIGIGGAPEGVLAAAALRCIGGQMQGRLQLNTEEKVARAAKMGISDPKKIYTLEEMAKGRCALRGDRRDGWQYAFRREIRAGLYPDPYDRDALVVADGA
ncbi:fructose-1,6-bisphosphatase [Brucella sp. NVSL 07-0026]|nr:fructose-1,6-bisphosphatase [Brucella sp. NVSL 07-0026]